MEVPVEQAEVVLTCVEVSSEDAPGKNYVLKGFLEGFGLGSKEEGPKSKKLWPEDEDDPSGPGNLDGSCTDIVPRTRGFSYSGTWESYEEPSAESQVGGRHEEPHRDL